MSAARTRRLLLAVAATDATFAVTTWRAVRVWEGKCLHCRRRHRLRLDGAPLTEATLEHITPRHHGGTDALRNLGIACARCNHGKGVRHDRRRADDPALRALVDRLQAERDARWRDDLPFEVVDTVAALVHEQAVSPPASPGSSSPR